MKQLTRVLVLFLLTTTLSTSTGCLYTNVRAPLDEDVAWTQLGTKIGRASSYSILWLVAWGDEGINAAAKNGGLKVINHTDQEVYSILFGLYLKHTVIAYGD